MGYMTSFDGKIYLKNKRAGKIIKYMMKEQIYPFDDLEYSIINFDGNKINIEIQESWKNYEAEMEGICYFVKLLDKKATGEISCEGEDKGDTWKIILTEKGIEILKGRVEYDSKCFFSNKEIEEEAVKTLNDKDLDKKMILCSLKEEGS